jgi:hypothetical protein
MRRTVHYGLFVALALTALCVTGPGWAGGGGFGSDEDDGKDAGPPYFGIVRDKDGNVIADAKITALIAKSNSTLVLRADSQGHFFVRGFDKSIDPKDVEISCGKEGFRTVLGAKSGAGDSSAPIEIICVLEHE